MYGNTTWASRKAWEDPNGQSTPWIFLSTEFVWLVTFFCDARRNQAGKNAARNGVGGEGMIFPSSKFRWNFPGTNHLNFDAISVISSFWRLQASSMNETSKFLFLFEYLKKSHRF
jgi:hypothetical protein